MRRAWVAVGAVIALVAAGAAVASAPDSTATTAPLYVDGRIGEPVTSRLLTSTVTNVRLADRLLVPYRDDVGDTRTDGVWVIVDATITMRQQYLVLVNTELSIGSRTFRVSDVTPAPSLLTPPEGSGIPQHGSLVFEIPLSALDDPGASHARVLFNPSSETRLDSVAAVTVDLAELAVLPSVRIDPPTIEERR
jgi:hypothetical protein